MNNHDFQAGSRPSEHRSCVGWFNNVEQQCLIPFECLAYVFGLPDSGFTKQVTGKKILISPEA
jgi:hypothetical protein